MPGDLKRRIPDLKSGDETFHIDDQELGFPLLSFWQWAASDLVSNATRGMLAEFIVAKALECELTNVRSEWDTYDLETKDGIKIEVKSSAYLQSWHQEKLSQVSFRIPKTIAWSPDTGLYEQNALRLADIYIFALLAHKDKSTVDPLNLSQWRFYVVPTRILNEHRNEQKEISLGSLESLGVTPVRYMELKRRNSTN